MKKKMLRRFRRIAAVVRSTPPAAAIETDDGPRWITSVAHQAAALAIVAVIDFTHFGELPPAYCRTILAAFDDADRADKIMTAVSDAGKIRKLVVRVITISRF